MKKKLLLIPITALLLGSGLILNHQYLRANDIVEETDKNDELFLGAKIQKLTDLNPTSPESDTPIGIQRSGIVNGKVSIRFIGAVRVVDEDDDGDLNDDLENMSAVWNRGLFRGTDNTFIKPYEAKASNKAYTALSNGGNPYTVVDYNADHGTNYTHFVTYVLKNIPWNDYRAALLDVYLTVNGVDTRGALTSVDGDIQFSYKPVANGYYGVKKTSSGCEAFEFDSYDNDLGSYRASVDLQSTDRILVLKKTNKEMSRFIGVAENSIAKANSIGGFGEYFFGLTGSYSVLICGETQPRLSLAPAESPIYEGNTIEYGLYPQTHVSDSGLITELNKLSPAFNGLYYFNNKYYAKLNATPVANAKFEDDTTIVSGQDYWFECDPIKWKVLTNASGVSYAIANAILDIHCFNATATHVEYGETIRSNNWVYSDIREWLNNDFYKNAFAFGRGRILTTKVDNSDNTNEGTNNQHTCADTMDRVYLPSHQDMFDYEADYGNKSAYVSDFAKAKGAVADANNYGKYWTRSPNSEYDYNVTTFYGANSLDDINSNTENCGVRPAIRLNIEAKDEDLTQITLNAPVEYGQFPQTHVKRVLLVNNPVLHQNEETINPLYTVLETMYNNPDNYQPNENGWYYYENSSDHSYDGYYARLVCAPCWNKYNGSGGIYFDDGEEIVKDQAEWFKVEPILWDVLETRNGEKLLLCRNGLTIAQFNTTDQTNNYDDFGEVTANNYAFSNARKWLNGYFYNIAFGSESNIQTTITKSRDNNSVCQDKLFLLSHSDLLNTAYGFAGNANATDTRACIATDYARALGLFIPNGSGSNHHCRYWTRSPGGYANPEYAEYVDSDGTIPVENVTVGSFFPRPAMYIKAI